MKSEKEHREYPISDDIALLHDKYVACEKLRDLAIKLPFGYWKARKAAADAEYFNRLFWKKVRQVYPEFENKELSYILPSQIIVKGNIRYLLTYSQ